MFETFKVGAPKTITLCNSAHPFNDHGPMSAKLCPKSTDVYYIRSKKDNWTATYRTTDNSLTIAEVSFEEFKELWDGQQWSNYEVVDLDTSKDKWIANAIMRELALIGLL